MTGFLLRASGLSLIHSVSWDPGGLSLDWPWPLLNPSLPCQSDFAVAPWCPSCPEGTVRFWFDAPAGRGRKDTFWHAFWPPLASPHLLKQRRKSATKASGFSAEENWVGLEQLEQLRGSREQHPDPHFSDFLFPTVSSKLCFLYGNPLRKKFFIRKVAFCEGKKKEKEASLDLNSYLIKLIQIHKHGPRTCNVLGRHCGEQTSSCLSLHCGLGRRMFLNLQIWKWTFM